MKEGPRLEIAGHPVFADPVGQARQAAAALYSAFAQEGLETIPVRPVVIFPGWNIRHAGEDNDVLIVNERELVEQVLNSPTVMEPRELIGASLFLERLK